jgi:uncharacterized protein (TIGR03067 family)
MRHLALVVMTLGLLAGLAGRLLASDDPPQAKDDLKKLQGTWRLIFAERDGTTAPYERIRSVRVTITGSTHTVRVGEQVVARDVPFEIDPEKTPAQVTDKLPDGEDKGKQIRGVYRLEGDDTLVSCMAPVEKDRPTGFSANAGSGLTLRIFRRTNEKDEEKSAAVEAEQKRFEGSWRFVSMEMEGKDLSANLSPDDRLELKDNQFTSRNQRGSITGVFSVDPTLKPKTIEVTMTSGPRVGATLHGIYELEGDRYKVSWPSPGKPRPTRFASAEGSGNSVHLMKRVKP